MSALLVPPKNKKRYACYVSKISKLGHPHALHDQVDNAQKALAEDEPLQAATSAVSHPSIHSQGRRGQQGMYSTHRGQNNQRRVLPPLVRPPPPREQAADGARERERGDIVHSCQSRHTQVSIHTLYIPAHTYYGTKKNSINCQTRGEKVSEKRRGEAKKKKKRRRKN